MSRKFLTPSERLEKAVTYLNEAGIDARLRRSKRDVPHIVGMIPGCLDTEYSLTYFGSTRTWRLFWPWRIPNQQRFDARELLAIVNQLNTLGLGGLCPPDPAFDDLDEEGYV